MPFSISGRIAAGADQALEEVLDRRLKEETRRQIERQNAAENQMRQQTIDLQRQSMAQSVANRAEDVKFRNEGRDTDNAERLYGRTEPGEISDQVAEALKKSPGIAPMIGTKKVIEGVRPIEGTAPLDTSGPQQYNTLEATPKQAKEKLQEVELKRISDMLKGTTTGAQRRQAAQDAFGSGINVPGQLLEATDEEKATAAAQKLAESRKYEQSEWDRRTAIGEANQRNRPPKTELTPGQAFQATRSLRNDFVRETAGAKTVMQQLGMMKAAWSEIEKGNIPPGSEAMIVTFNKILDPNSVVREGEYARSLEGQAFLKQLESQWQRTVQGGNILPTELKKFMILSEKFAEKAVKSAKDSQRQIDAIAQEYGLNPANITRDYDQNDAKDAANEVGPKKKTADELLKLYGSGGR